MSYYDSKYKELIINYDENVSTVTASMKSRSRQCYTLSMLLELLELFQNLDEYGSPDPSRPGDVQYFVMKSENPLVFNSGGDLLYFADLVTSNDREKLMDYATLCIDLIHWLMHGGKRRITTVACVSGSALGGGFEATLAHNYIIAEKQSVFAFPEALFGYFPGMGGYDMLARFAGRTEADRAFMTGKRYSAQDLYKLGVVYGLAETGEGMKSVNAFIRDRNSSRNTHIALQKLKNRSLSLDYETLKYNIDLWVDASQNLTKRDLRVMLMLARKQHKKENKSIAVIESLSEVPPKWQTPDMRNVIQLGSKSNS